MPLSRREIVKLFGLSFVASLPGTDVLSAPFKGVYPTSPLPRMPLDEFVTSAARMASLRKGIKEMKKRKPSDPLSFFYQAAIHGATDEAIKKATSEDPGVPGVIKFWNQCPHNGQNAANFLPWHRGYTYHFEKILRMHTGDDSFSLPYWNYVNKKNRKFPREFGIEHLDGNMQNSSEDNINPLFLAQRDFYFTSYEHPFAKGLPLLELSDSAVDISLPMKSPVFFGETEREGLGGGIADTDASTRGLLESYPHDQIHRAVGGILPNSCSCACTPAPGEEPDFDAAGAMAQPPTAGFDPIFSIHHCMIDWIWVQWACLPGKKWGKLPPDAWFNEKPWFFFDTDGTVVNEPRKYYFDHRKLGIRFKYENLACHPLSLPSISQNFTEKFTMPIKKLEKLDENKAEFRVLPFQSSVIPVAGLSISNIRTHALDMISKRLANFQQKRIILRIPVVDTMNTEATGFDLHLTTAPGKQMTRSDDSFIGTVSLFNHLPGAMHMDAAMQGMGQMEGMDRSQSFDVSKAIAAGENVDNLSLVVVPYSLFTQTGSNATLLPRFPLKLKGMEFYLAS